MTVHKKAGERYKVKINHVHKSEDEKGVMSYILCTRATKTHIQYEKGGE